MATNKVQTLGPRKQPRQVRSLATVDAIFEATIQVLLREGLQRLTTVRVAERAGVSVGTLYQYYPHKQALLFGVLQRHLSRVTQSLEAAATALHHASLATMVSGVVAAFVAAKTERIEESRALSTVAGGLDSRELVCGAGERNRTALAAMLASASDAQFDDLEMAAFMFSAALVGPTRLVIDGQAPNLLNSSLTGQLESLCLGYLQREARPREPAPAESRVLRPKSAGAL